MESGECYFYYQEQYAAADNQQLSLFEVFEEKGQDKELEDAVFRMTANCPIMTLDIKKQYRYYDKNGTERYFDAVIGAYLLNPLKNDYDAESIANEYLNRIIPGWKELFGKKTML